MTGMLHKLFALDEPESPGQVLFYRVFELVIAYWVLLFAWSWGMYLTRISEVVLPLGIATYLDVSFMFGQGMGPANAALITIAMAAGFFRLARSGYLIALLLLHLQYTSRYSLGEISHGSNVIGVALLGMALGALLFEVPRRSRRFVFGFTYFFLGLGYTSAAICKLIASGPFWVDGAHLWMWIQERAVDTFSITGTMGLNTLQEWIMDSRLLGTAILTFGIVTEFFGFLMWFRRTRVAIMLLCIGMHVGILWTMKINFPANNALLITLALPWGLLLDRAVGSGRSEQLMRLAQRLG